MAPAIHIDPLEGAAIAPSARSYRACSARYDGHDRRMREANLACTGMLRPQLLRSKLRVDSGYRLAEEFHRLSSDRSRGRKARGLAMRLLLRRRILVYVQFYDRRAAVKLLHNCGQCGE